MLGKKKHKKKNKEPGQSKAVSIPLGAGVVSTARITSKGILFAGRKHYNSEHIQRYRGREVLVHEVGGYMKAYLYESSSNLLGRLLCVHDMNGRKMERSEPCRDHPDVKEESNKLDWEEALNRVMRVGEIANQCQEREANST